MDGSGATVPVGLPEERARSQTSAHSHSRYTLLEAVVGKGQRLVISDEIESVPDVDGRPGYRLTEQGMKDGIARLTWVTGVFNDRGLHGVMTQAVFADQESWEFYRKPVLFSGAFFVLLLFAAVPRDRRGGRSGGMDGGCAGRSW